MTTELQKRFTVISSPNAEKKKEEHTKSYQTNPLTEKLMKFTNNEGGRKFGIQDLLR